MPDCRRDHVAAGIDPQLVAVAAPRQSSMWSASSMGCLWDWDHAVDRLVHEVVS